MTQIETSNNRDQTVRIFDNFYGKSIIVNAVEFDLVYGYFTNISDTTLIANNFTNSLFRIANESGTPVLELLNLLKGTNNKLEMNGLMCYYMNSFKSLTALYGTGVTPAPNYFIARNVVQ